MNGGFAVVCCAVGLAGAGWSTWPVGGGDGGGCEGGGSGHSVKYGSVCRGFG